MRIGFDAKRAFSNNTGLGNYSRDAIRVLSHYFPDNKYLLYTPKNNNNPRFSFIADKENIVNAELIDAPEEIKEEKKSEPVKEDGKTSKKEEPKEEKNKIPTASELKKKKTF